MVSQAIDNQTGAIIPARGEWPADPQEALAVDPERLWIDGCFDFAHHGHAGAIFQAKQLGHELVVGVHSDAEIHKNKGPLVMTLAERVAAVEACRWADKAVPHAPYVTSIPWINHYGCHDVVHGDDITSDSNGEDCYRFVKSAGRFRVVKRTPGISTTDLVGRMLLFTKNHFLKNFRSVLDGQEGPGDEAERMETGKFMYRRLIDYATDSTGKEPHVEVWSWAPIPTTGMNEEQRATSRYCMENIVLGKPPLPAQRLVYVDGTFDLFSTGHIEFLKRAVEKEEKAAEAVGWYDSQAVRAIEDQTGRKLSPVYLIVGLHEDEMVNNIKGSNYPIMNTFERGLCVLQCKYVNAVIFGAPFIPAEAYLDELPYGRPHSIYHGPTASFPPDIDPYRDSRKLGLFHEIDDHSYSHINASEIVTRVLKNRSEFEARQKAKGFKSDTEQALHLREKELKEQSATSMT